jgi:hypothetical protein
VAYVEKKRVLLGEWEDVTGDRERDGLICAVRAIERREGERRGWDQPARLWTLHLADIDSDAVEIRPVPGQAWRRGRGNPVDDLLTVAVTLPEPPAELPAVRFADCGDGLAAVAFMYEAWAAPDESLTAEQRRRAEAGERVRAESPDRVEMRGVVVVDVNGQRYSLERLRDREPRLRVEGADESEFRGRLFQALQRIVYAARRGTWP